MSKDVDMSILFNLPPDKAIEYLKDLGFVITANWQDVLEDSEKRAFTIAGVMKKDILEDAKDIVTKGVKEGKAFESIKNEFGARMQAKGWETSTHRLRTIYRTNSDIAYSVGRYREQEATKDFAPYWQYIAIMDNNTRPAHANMHGKVFRSDDPIWDYWYPPNGFFCRCMVRTHTESKLKRRNLEVEGSKGKLKEVDIQVGNKTYKTHEYDGNKIDAGWDYNPGKNIRKIGK